MISLVFINSLHSQEKEISIGDWWETTVRFYEIIDSVPQYEAKLDQFENKKTIIINKKNDGYDEEDLTSELNKLDKEVDAFVKIIDKRLQEAEDLKEILVTSENIIGNIFLEQSTGQTILFQNFVTEYSDKIGNEIISDHKCENALIVHHASDDWDLFTIFVHKKITVKKNSYVQFGEYDFYLFSNYYDEENDLSGLIFKSKSKNE